MNKEQELMLKQFGQNIKNMRLKKGISLDELSLKTGICQSYLSKIEQGKAERVKASHVFILAEALETKASVLLENI